MTCACYKKWNLRTVVRHHGLDTTTSSTVLESSNHSGNPPWIYHVIKLNKYKLKKTKTGVQSFKVTVSVKFFLIISKEKITSCQHPHPHPHPFCCLFACLPQKEKMRRENEDWWIDHNGHAGGHISTKHKIIWFTHPWVEYLSLFSHPSLFTWQSLHVVSSIP